MLAWRLCRAPFADLSGEGARRYGGRWNSPGLPLVYAASAAALAVLEVRVHLDLPFELLPDDFVLVTIDLDRVAIEDVEDTAPSTQAFGDTWLREKRTALLRVPSIIVPETANFLINPAHPDSVGVTVLQQRRFGFDRRLWLS